ncbi:MAG: helix-turn-helix domain-containing protein, partial [Chloroflexota bacterium]|nr:helix-turn-helix domain-containing protein [Chloroflexota bacterium]
MSERRRQSLEKFLQDPEVQKLLLERMVETRSKATVTIGKAKQLFDFSENQLRDWERRGWLSPQRNPTEREDLEGTEGRRHRQYSMEELDLLATIRELMNRGYTTNEIGQKIEHIWRTIDTLDEQLINDNNGAGTKLYNTSLSDEKAQIPEVRHKHMDDYADEMYANLFWKSYTSMAMRLAFYAITELIPPTFGALILPMKKQPFVSIDSNDPKKIEELGSSLVGWLGQSRNFHTRITD